MNKINNHNAQKQFKISLELQKRIEKIQVLKKQRIQVVKTKRMKI